MGGDRLIATDLSSEQPPLANLLRRAALAIALVLTVLLGVRAAHPPAPLPVSAPPKVFSADRAMIDVRAIAVRPHPTGSADNARVRDYLARRLAGMGLHVEQRHYLIDQPSLARLLQWSNGRDRPSELVDVLGVLPGRDPSLPALMLMAHYDTVWGSPGAPDDTAGVASALEVVRALKARGRPLRTVKLLFTDSEEIGLSGGRAFWQGDIAQNHVGIVINLESRGGGGRATMFETGVDNGAMMALFARAVRHPVANSMTVLAYRHMPNDTDFTPVRKLGIPGFNFAMLGRAALYHSPLATPDRLDPGSVQDMGGQALDLASALASSPSLPPRMRDATFFDVGGAWLIHYAPGFGWLILLGAAGCWGAAWIGARRAGLVTIGGVVAGLASALWLAAIGAMLLETLNLVSLTPSPNYYDRLAKLPLLEAQAILAAIGSLIGFMALKRPRPRIWAAVAPLALALFGMIEGGGSWLALLGFIAAAIGLLAGREGAPLWGGWLGALLLLLLIALLVQWEAAQAAWLFAWPALLTGAAAALAAWLDPRMRGLGILIAAGAAVAAVAPLLPLAHLAFLAVGASIAVGWTVLLPIPAAAFWPIGRLGGGHRIAWLIAAACLVAALVIAVRARTSPLAPSVPAYSLDKPAR